MRCSFAVGALAAGHGDTYDPGMARVTVSADRAVLGQFPPICVRTGERADGFVSVESTVGGPSPWALLLVFLGPIGWLVLLGILVAVRGEKYRVRLPYRESAWESIRRTSVAGYVLLGVAAVVLVAGLLLRQEGVAILAAIVVAAIGVVVCLASNLMMPRLDLDATRRWITIRDVHPAFADATRALESHHPANR
jgi:hypothetical protein